VVPDEDNQNEQAQEEERPQEDQIDSTLKPPDEQDDAPEQESVRENEIHDEYEHSDEEPMEQSPYDPNEVWELDVNIKYKVRTLKKLILEKINLDKAANIILLKQVPNENQSQIQ
jgi:hypothetical protein